MNFIRKRPLLGLICGAVLSLALLGCGSSGYKRPRNPPPGSPPTYPPGSASSYLGENTTQATTAGNMAMPSARAGR